MRQDIAERLLACYPKGIWDLFDENQADYSAARRYWARLPKLLEQHGFVTSGPHVWSQQERVVEFPIRRSDEPEGWFFNTHKNQKIAYLRDSGTPHVHIKVRISTVVPAIHFGITETWFNPDTWGDHANGRYDDGLKTINWLPDTRFEPWASLVADLRALAIELAIEEFDRDTLLEDVPSISSPIFSDEDDTDDEDLLGDWTSDDNVRYIKSLPQQVACVYDCLFGDVL